MSSETIPARFSKKDVKLLDYFVEEGTSRPSPISSGSRLDTTYMSLA
ncbi:MAG: hypothetical protein QMC85_01730 [Methanocellales archaeon]|nr:hypothetical protein [Methanocellales archaeon]